MLRTLLVVALSSLMVACTNTAQQSDSNSYSTEFDGLPPGSRILLVPLAPNFKQLSAGSDVVLLEMTRQLEACGRVPLLQAKDRYMEQWSATVWNIGGLYNKYTGQLDEENQARAMRAYAQAMAKTESFSAVFFSSFEIRTADLDGRYAAWDGVERRQQAWEASAGATEWSGNTRGLSLKIVAYDAAGHWLFTSYGGLVLPYRARGGKIPDLEIRDRLFEQADEIASGVEVALYPLLYTDRVEGQASLH